MRICMVTIDNPVHHAEDGISISVNELSRALTKQGHEVWVMGLDQQVQEETTIENDGVRYICLPSPGGSLPRRMVRFMAEGKRRIESLEKEEKIDVFHGHGGFAGPVAWADIRARKVLTMHTSHEEDLVALEDLKECGMLRKYLQKQLFPPLPLLKRYRKWYFNRVDKIISVSEHNVKAALPRMGVPRERYAVIPNGVDYRRFREFKLRSRPEEDENTLLYFGRLAPCKGVQHLIRAYPRVLEKHPRSRLKIVGEGNYRVSLEALSGRTNAGGTVEFLGFRSGDRLWGTIASSGMVVVPSTYEGCPLTMLEAMALGKPVVASSIPGVNEVMKHGVSGWTFAPADHGALAESVDTLMSDPDLRARLGRNAERTIRERFDWPIIGKRVVKVYGEI